MDHLLKRCKMMTIMNYEDIDHKVSIEHCTYIFSFSPPLPLIPFLSPYIISTLKLHSLTPAQFISLLSPPLSNIFHCLCAPPPPLTHTLFSFPLSLHSLYLCHFLCPSIFFFSLSPLSVHPFNLSEPQKPLPPAQPRPPAQPAPQAALQASGSESDGEASTDTETDDATGRAGQRVLYLDAANNVASHDPNAPSTSARTVSTF